MFLTSEKYKVFEEAIPLTGPVDVSDKSEEAGNGSGRGSSSSCQTQILFEKGSNIKVVRQVPLTSRTPRHNIIFQFYIAQDLEGQQKKTITPVVFV